MLGCAEKRDTPGIHVDHGGLLTPEQPTPGPSEPTQCAPPTVEDRFIRAYNTLVEFFPDVLLMVRQPRGEIRLRTTDATWASGATGRLKNHVDECDRLEQRDAHYDE